MPAITGPSEGREILGALDERVGRDDGVVPLTRFGIDA